MVGFYLIFAVLLLAFVAFVAFLLCVSRDQPLTVGDVDQLRKEAESYAQTEEFARFYRQVKAVADKPSEAST
jgi:hypothetical protein